ncbi:amidoligase family protein [Paenibacillus koleovorans]|uniref:amidoligase family protein n=1 Tax=Paenibacillus koleovorans TaxID=121608 RepID=UPI000FD993C7|nr:amidoligase family protein [Paenibacillus koleovorans]
MWPRKVQWKQLRFGVEIEFVGGSPSEIELLPGWVMALDELHTDANGVDTGAELKPPPMLWQDRDQIGVMLRRLREHGVQATWSCGLHVHVGLAHWGEDIVIPLVDAALATQDALERLLQTSAHRRVFAPPVAAEMREKYLREPIRDSLCYTGRPESHRCGINVAAWFDFGTVEIRFANGSLDEEEVLRTIELCLRYVAAIGEGRTLPGGAGALAEALGAPAEGYPAAAPAPKWHLDRMHLADALIPVLAPCLTEIVEDGEILEIHPSPEGITILTENEACEKSRWFVRMPKEGWKLERID